MRSYIVTVFQAQGYCKCRKAMTEEQKAEMSAINIIIYWNINTVVLPRMLGLWGPFLKLLGGKLAPKMVYFVLRKELLKLK